VSARIPFVDLHAQYLAHRSEIDAAIQSVIAQSAYIGGAHVRAFEQAFAAATGRRHCVSCGNGTDAIYVLLRMLGIGPGDEVVTGAISWISTSETISQAGATPVFVDMDPCFGLDAQRLEAAITPRTRAIIPVHLYGQCADMGAILEIAARHGLHVIEDCAQAHLATHAGREAGSMGIAGTFSFYPGKNLGAYGDAGAIVTDDEHLARRCRAYANHGALVKHQHEMEGINSRLDGLQAAILSAKLPHLREWTRRRQAVARAYDEALAGIEGVEMPRRRPDTEHVFHLYVIRTRRRDDLRQYLSERGIESQVHYPTALPLLPAYRRLGHVPEDFPLAHAAQSELLSLPMYAELPLAAVREVADAIREFHHRA
jgi:dTDP-4-amino-4,6-dideoxygalactose transaminase